jgi:putative toxin-antitoxin system antitoxin component (TIGR02293 family)
VPKKRFDDDGIYRTARDYTQIVRESAGGSHPYLLLLGMRSCDTPELLEQIEEGVTYAAFERLQRAAGLSIQELSEIVQISARTLNRRKKENGRFDPDESDRLVRLSRILGRALELFEGDLDGARDWLARPQVGLGGARPFDVVKSEVGAREVEALIGRLEHGVVS